MLLFDILHILYIASDGVKIVAFSFLSISPSSPSSITLMFVVSSLEWNITPFDFFDVALLYTHIHFVCNGILHYSYLQLCVVFFLFNI